MWCEGEGEGVNDFDMYRVGTMGRRLVREFSSLFGFLCIVYVLFLSDTHTLSLSLSRWVCMHAGINFALLLSAVNR
jgi:hypothetical protein